MALKSTFARQVDTIVVPIARVLVRLGATPNWLTAAGVVLTGAAAWLLVARHPLAAGCVLIAGSLADTFDGPVARLRGAASPLGGFYDSVADRVSDAVILLALAWVVRDQPRLFALTAVALATAGLTSYIRARAEAAGRRCDVGLIERGERAILLIVGLILYWTLEAVLWTLSVGGVLTVLQRLAVVRRQFLEEVT